MAGTVLTIIGIAIAICIIVAILVFDIWDTVDLIKALFTSSRRSRIAANSAYQAFPQLREHYNTDEIENLRFSLTQNLDKLYSLREKNDNTKEDFERFIIEYQDNIIALVKSLHNIEKNSSEIDVNKSTSSGLEALRDINNKLEELIDKHSTS